MVSVGASASASALSKYSGLISFKADWFDFLPFVSVQFSSVAQSCPTLCGSMNHSTPGFPVYHQLLEFIQTHIHRIGNNIQPSHPLSSPSPPALNLSQHQGLFQMSQLGIVRAMHYLPFLILTTESKNVVTLI